MKNIVSEILERENEKAMREFCGEREFPEIENGDGDESDEPEEREEPEEKIFPDDRFFGLHPNHHSHGRAKLAYGRDNRALASLH